MALRVLVLLLCILEALANPYQQPYADYQCNLYNEHYPGEPLFAASSLLQLNIFSRSVYLWRMPSSLNKQLAFTPDDQQSVWRLEPVANRPSTFYIRNAKYGEYLHASSMHMDLIFSHRRFVYMWKSTSSAKNQESLKNNEAYMWTFREPYVDLSKPSYPPNQSGYFGFNNLPDLLRVTIWNVKYNEPFYASAFTGGKSSGSALSRNVYTYYKPPDSTQFNWLVKCRDSQYPILGQLSYYNF